MNAKEVFLKEVRSAAAEAPRLFFAPLTGAVSGAIKEVRNQLHRGERKASTSTKPKQPIRA